MARYDRFPWNNVKPLVRRKVELVLDEFHEKHPLPVTAPTQPFNYEELKKEILTSLDSFTGAPFTIQRICELLTLPTKHYKRTDKFMRGLEKNVLVVSHIDPKHTPATDRPLSPPKSIFAAESSYHVFERSLNHSDMTGGGSAGPSSSSGIKMEESFRSRDSFLISDQPGTSSSSSSSSGASSSKILLPSLSCPNPQTPAPLQQLDSFTTVFSSPPSTPLAVVTNMPPFDPTSSSSSSSSSGSSCGSSPHPDAEPASPPENPEGHSFESRSSFSDRSSSESSQSNPAAADDSELAQTAEPPPEQIVVPQDVRMSATAAAANTDDSSDLSAPTPAEKIACDTTEPIEPVVGPEGTDQTAAANATAEKIERAATGPEEQPSTSSATDTPATL